MKSKLILFILSVIFSTNLAHAEYNFVCSSKKFQFAGPNGIEIPAIVGIQGTISMYGTYALMNYQVLMPSGFASVVSHHDTSLEILSGPPTEYRFEGHKFELRFFPSLGADNLTQENAIVTWKGILPDGSFRKMTHELRCTDHRNSPKKTEPYRSPLVDEFEDVPLDPPKSTSCNIL